ncbi:GLPGLI family protein, partial [Chryseobacterium sp. HMWF001]
MKFYLLFLVFSSSFIYSQSDTLRSQYEIIYKIRCFDDTLSKKNPSEENLSLLISGNKSLFRSTQKAVSDSIAMSIGNKAVANAVNGKVVVDMRGVPGVYFKSEVFSDNGKQIIYKELMKNRFSYPLEDPITWKIKNETKIIESYLCKKAIGKYKGRYYIAWFTETIPIPDGPYIFKQLPGLALEVYDQNDTIHFTMISFRKARKAMLLMKNAYPTQYSNFYKARQNMIENPAGMLSNQTGIKLNPSDVERINKNAKRNN